MSIQPPDHYATLGVDACSSFREIQKAFFKLSLSCHPDKLAPSEAEEAHRKFVAISAAYNVLKDPESRRRCERQQARYASQAATKKCETEEGPSERGHGFYPESEETDEAKQSQPQEDSYADDATWLRYRTVKNNLQGLSFSLKDSLHRIQQLIRSLRDDDTAKKRAAKAKVQLRLISKFFLSVQEEMEAVLWPSCLMETTVLRIEKMMKLENSIQEFLTMLESRAHEEITPDQEAREVSKLLLKDMGKWTQLCR